MIQLDTTFDQDPWGNLLADKMPGASVSASFLLTQLESEEDDAVEDLLRTMEERNLLLDISDLPKAAGTGEAALRLREEEQLVRSGLNYRTLETNDPLRLYLEEVAGTPCAGDEQVLAQKAVGGSESAKLMLTNMGLSRVISVAGEHVGYGVLLLDLIQEGSLGLWETIEEYRDGDYAAQVDFRIRSAIGRAVFLHARSTGVGRKMRAALEDYRAVDERLLSELGRNPTIEEMAEQLHMTVEEAEIIRKNLEDARAQQRNQREQEPKEAEADEEQAVEDTAYFQARQRIMELLSVLSEEDAKLLTLRYGLDKGVPMTPEETGKRLGLTAQEVNAREARALALLRAEK